LFDTADTIAPNGKGGNDMNPIYVSIPASDKVQDEKQGPPEGAKSEPEPAIVLARQNRLAWIDGLRGLASLVIFTHHFADLTWADSHPNTLAWGTVYSFIRNGQLAVGMYFLLGGRVLVHGFHRSAFAPPRVPKDSHGAVIEGAPLIRAPGPKWLSLASSLFRRSIRLAFPAIVIGFIQWRVCMDGLVTNAPIEAANVSIWIFVWVLLAEAKTDLTRRKWDPFTDVALAADVV
jgi:Acyltransferase family